jgi:periplasmic divalent cation tolerance protein
MLVNMTAAIAYVTAANKDDALRIARTLVDERLAACGNVLDGMTSVYRWQGVIETASEAVLIVKTRSELIPRVIERVRELHTYQCPCVVSWPIAAGNPEYLKWIGEETTVKGNLIV